MSPENIIQVPAYKRAAEHVGTLYVEARIQAATPSSYAATRTPRQIPRCISTRIASGMSLRASPGS